MARGSLTSLKESVRGRVVSDPASLAAFGGDGSHLVGRPLAAVAPADTSDVVRLVEWARQHHVALSPRGAATSLDGESVPEDGAVVVDLSGWRRIHEVSVEGRWARVEPGVVNLALQIELRPRGLFFPPNPGSWETCTIGGNIGTNASGPRSLRYGPTRAWVRELEVVLGTGELVRLGTRAEKRSLGPDLLSAFVGSEGTLGIVTEATVRLAPLPSARRAALFPLPAQAPLGALAMRLRATGAGWLSALEYLDATSAGVFPEAGASGIPEGPALLVEVEGDDLSGDIDRRLVRLATVLGEAGVPSAPIAFPDADQLWSIRGAASRLLDRRFGSRIREDVAVPVAQVDELLRVIARIAEAERVAVYTFAHLGEGTLHPNFVVDPSSPAAHRIRRALYSATLSLHGTISSEHGAGRLKRGFVAWELGAPALRLLRAWKAACDPDGILNPGVLFDPEPAPRPSRSPSAAGAARSPSRSPTGGRRPVRSLRPSRRPGKRAARR